MSSDAILSPFARERTEAASSGQRIEVWDCVVPLGKPLEVSGRQLTERRNTLVRLADRGGVEGVAAALCRGHATAAELGGLAPALVAAGEPARLARIVGIPLWRALDGAQAQPVPTIVYGGVEPWLSRWRRPRGSRPRRTSPTSSTSTSRRRRAARGSSAWVERVEPGGQVDPLDILVRSRARFEGGRLVAPSEPGLAVEVDSAAAATYARTSWKA